MSDNATSVDAEGSNRTRHRRNALLAMAGLTAVVALMFSGFCSGFGNPSPREIPVAVVATPSVQANLDASPALWVHDAADDADAARMVADRDVYGALEFTGPNTVKLLVASGGGHSVSSALTSIATELTTRSGAELEIQDLAPTSSNDPNGTVEFYVIVYLAIGAALGSTVLSRVIGPVRTLRHLARRLLTLVFYTGVVSLTITMLADLAYGALVGHFGLLLLVLWAYAFSIAVAVSGVSSFFGGVAGMALTLTMVILGNTSAAGAVGRPLQNGFFQAINPFFPHGAGLSIIRGVQYFGGRGIAQGIWTLAIWTAAGLALFVLHTLRAERHHGKHEVGAAASDNNPERAADTATSPASPALQGATPVSVPAMH